MFEEEETQSKILGKFNADNFRKKKKFYEKLINGFEENKRQLLESFSIGWNNLQIELLFLFLKSVQIEERCKHKEQQQNRIYYSVLQVDKQSGEVIMLFESEPFKEKQHLIILNLIDMGGRYIIHHSRVSNKAALIKDFNEFSEKQIFIEQMGVYFQKKFKEDIKQYNIHILHSVNSPGDKALKCLYFLHKLVLLGEDFETIQFDAKEIDELRDKYYFLLLNILSESEIKEQRLKIRQGIFQIQIEPKLKIKSDFNQQTEQRKSFQDALIQTEIKESQNQFVQTEVKQIQDFGINTEQQIKKECFSQTEKKLNQENNTQTEQKQQKDFEQYYEFQIPKKDFQVQFKVDSCEKQNQTQINKKDFECQHSFILEEKSVQTQQINSFEVIKIIGLENQQKELWQILKEKFKIQQEDQTTQTDLGKILIRSSVNLQNLTESRQKAPGKLNTLKLSRYTSSNLTEQSQFFLNSSQAEISTLPQNQQIQNNILVRLHYEDQHSPQLKISLNDVKKYLEDETSDLNKQTMDYLLFCLEEQFNENNNFQKIICWPIRNHQLILQQQVDMNLLKQFFSSKETVEKVKKIVIPIFDEWNFEFSYALIDYNTKEINKFLFPQVPNNNTNKSDLALNNLKIILELYSLGWKISYLSIPQIINSNKTGISMVYHLKNLILKDQIKLEKITQFETKLKNQISNKLHYNFYS